MTREQNSRRLHLLHTAVAAAAPILSVTAGKWNDRSTWKVQFDDVNEPTQAQLDAAAVVLATFDPDAPTAEEARLAALQGDAQVVDWIAKLSSSDNAQIDTFFANNVTTAAQAINVLKAVVKVLAYKLR